MLWDQERKSCTLNCRIEFKGRGTVGNQIPEPVWILRTYKYLSLQAEDSRGHGDD